jgi:hypothetical protein
MLISNDEKTRRELGRATTVNRRALNAWLQAWTTGASFPNVTTANLNPSPQSAKDHLAHLRHGRPKDAENNSNEIVTAQPFSSQMDG